MIFEFCGGRGVRAGGQKMNHWIKKCPNFYFGMIRMMIARAFILSNLGTIQMDFFRVGFFLIKKDDLRWDLREERDRHIFFHLMDMNLNFLQKITLILIRSASHNFFMIQILRRMFFIVNLYKKWHTFFG